MSKSLVPTPHLEAKVGDIAETVLLPGDPLRAKFIAETFLEDVVQYNTVRGMYGYTGYYNGKRISVQGSGMGMPSMGIYSYELIHFYGVKNLIRIGSAGAISDKLNLHDVVIGMAASDVFYGDNGLEGLKSWQKMGALCVEMEAAALYMNAARAGVNALCIVTISDCPLRGLETTSAERQTAFTNMMKIALSLA